MTPNRLATVLRVRRLQERQARAALAASALAHRRATDAEHRARTATAQAGGSPAMVTATDLLARRAVVEAALLAVDRRAVATGSAATARARDDADWVAANRRVDALERADDRLRQDALAEVRRLAQVEIDDLVVGRHRPREAR